MLQWVRGITTVIPQTHVTLQWICEVTKELWEFADYPEGPRRIPILF